MKTLINIIITMILIQEVGTTQNLDDYFKIAAENNPELLAQYKEYEAALERIPQMSSLADPTFSFGYFISPVETRVGPQRARFSLSQMFPWFGTLKAKGDIAALMAEAKFNAFLDSKNKLYFQLADVYYSLYELERWKMIEQENISILESYKSISTSKFENGNGSLTDVLRVDLLLNESKTSYAILRQKKRPLTTAFNQLLNRKADGAVNIPDLLIIEQYPQAYTKDSMLVNHPLLHALELKYEAAIRAEELATKQGHPNIGIGLDYVIVGERGDMNIPENGKDVLMPMVTISIPLYRKKYKAAQKEAQLMQESYAFQKTELENSLTSSYEMAWFQIQQQKQLIMLYEQQIQTSQQSLNLLYTSYGNSGKEFEEVLRMQQQLLKYEKMKATAEVQYQITWAKIIYLTAK
jgi:outer membrane protein, heavy metal efflux system